MAAERMGFILVRAGHEPVERHRHVDDDLGHLRLHAMRSKSAATIRSDHRLAEGRSNERGSDRRRVFSGRGPRLRQVRWRHVRQFAVEIASEFASFRDPVAPALLARRGAAPAATAGSFRQAAGAARLLIALADPHAYLAARAHLSEDIDARPSLIEDASFRDPHAVAIGAVT